MSESPPFYREACAEATENHDDAILANTGGEEAGSHAAKAVLANLDRLWTNGVALSYSFIAVGELSSFQQNQQNKVQSVASEWQKHANIAFVHRQSDDASIRITFAPDGGSWSFVGTEIKKIELSRPTMNLGWISGESDVISDEERGVILHEFGHALGLLHEHQSPLKGDKIMLKEEVVVEFYQRSQGWTPQQVEDQIIKVYNTQEISNFSEVDLTSIMRYFMPPEMNEQGIRIKPNNKLSEIDKAFIAINYPFPITTTLPTEANPDGNLDAAQYFKNALGVAGVAGTTYTTLVDFYRKSDWEQVRYTFNKWCLTNRIAGKPAQGVKPADEPPLPEGFMDGCLTESLADEIAPDDSGSGASKGVATSNHFLWTPGARVTFAFLQGDTEATTYRKKRVRDVLGAYAAKANLQLEEVPWDADTPRSDIRFFFGVIPKKGVSGWGFIGRRSVGLTRTLAQIEEYGGNRYSSIVISTTVLPATGPPTSSDDRKREQKSLYHEIGHALGLDHEHESPNTLTKDTVAGEVSMATFFDENSVMLYPGRTMRTITGWQQFRDFFNTRTTKYTYVPSAIDLAFLGAIYPFRSGHDSDNLAADLRTLGLGATDVTTLTDLRNTAFNGTRGSFGLNILLYRNKMQEYFESQVKASSFIKNTVPPSHFNSARDAQVDPPAKATTGPFLDELMKTLSAFFKPTTGQIFALQFPGRFLQQDLYAWDTNKAGIYGQFVKPTVVNESEFRLVDQLYNVGQVIGAPSGINLSIVYEQCLNNLIPRVPTSAINFQKQQSQIRDWLLKDVPTSGWVKDLITSQNSTGASVTKTSSTTGPAGAAHSINSSSAINPDLKPQFAVADKLSGDNKVNRMELSQALTQEYLAAKQAWELERDDMIKNAKAEDLDALTRRLAHITAIRESQLASKYADAVVRGYSHVIRQYLGYMDIKTPAETLQDAKDALRESAMSSLDGSMKVYPVQLSPVDWFQSLSTSFTMEDLTMNTEAIAQQLDIKSRQIDELNARLALIQANPKQSVKDLQDKLDLAQKAYDEASADLSTRYMSNVISLAKTCINKNNEFSMTDFSKAAKASKIAVAAFDNIEEGMKQLTQTQQAVTQSSRALTTLMAAKSLAEASDTAQEIVELQVQITSLRRDVAELTSRLQALRYQPPPDPPKTDPSGNPKAPSVDDIDLYPPETSSGGSRWQEIYMKHTVDTKYNASSEQSSASTRTTNVSLFFGSYHSESSESQSTASSTSFAQSVDVEVGFRATMVTVDRGGWFQPQFFKQSAGFHCIDNTITWSKWPSSVKTFQDLVDNEDKSVFDSLNAGLIPAFPTGFLVCKDITIRIRMQDKDIKAAGAEMEKFAASSAGILCWSTSSSDHSKSSDKSYSFVQKADGCVIRIPGPQILGYILQFTDNDKTEVVPDKLPDGFLLSDADYNSAFAVNPTTATTATTTTTTTPPPKV